MEEKLMNIANSISKLTDNYLIYLFFAFIDKLPAIFGVLVFKKVIFKDLDDTRRRYVIIYCAVMMVILWPVRVLFTRPHYFMGWVERILN